MKKILILLICIFAFVSCNKESTALNEVLKNERIMLQTSIDSLKKVKANTIAFNDSLNKINQYIMNNQESRERNDRLISERMILEKNVKDNIDKNNFLKNQHNALLEQIKRDNLALAVSKTVYIVRIKIHQTTYSLSVSEHIKNKINDVEFEIPVDKEYYDKCYNGQTVTDPGLKIGSLLRDGDFSKLKIKVVGKRTVRRY